MFKYNLEGGIKMAKLFATILGFFGTVAATAGSAACIMFYFDEPECPKSLIEK